MSALSYLERMIFTGYIPGCARNRGRRGAALVFVALAAALVPASAHAESTLGFANGHYTLAGGDGSNTLKLDYGPGYIEFEDFLGEIFDGGGLEGHNCAYTFQSDERVQCDRQPNESIRTVLDGGGGNDNVSGGSLADTVLGGGGNDRIDSLAGDDILDGGPGNDVLLERRYSGSLTGQGGHGADRLIGGPGTDRFSYTERTDPITVTLDGLANDGEAGEGDNVGSDIEFVEGGDGPSRLFGDGGPNRLEGTGFENTEIHGGGGNDTLNGGAGPSQVFGDAGNDDVRGSAGNDLIDGGAGTDSLYGDEDTCSFTGCSGGNDTIRARDGEADSIACGPGADQVTVDTLDTVAPDCESVYRAAFGQPAGGSGTRSGATVSLKLAKTLALGKALRKGFFFRFTSDQAGGVSAKAVISKKAARKLGLARTVTVARGSKKLRSAGTVKVKMRFTRKAKRRLRRARKVKLVLKATFKDAAGRKRSVRRKLTLKR